MQAFNTGDIDAFNKLCSENQEVTFRGERKPPSASFRARLP